jgi:uncharacterized protein YndB with AHSA1/START domain
MHHVFRQTLVPAPPAAVWRDLTDPARVSRWFAAADRVALGQRFRFDFGDGDFFAGEVLEWDEPSYLHLAWRFMDLGPRFHIRFYLTPLPEGTEVTVHDHGSQSVEEAQSLRAGWEDFLERLRQHAATGANVRYLWSETIGIGALLAGAGPRPPELDDRAFWERAFPGAAVQAERRGESELRLAFEEERWGGARTEALVETAPADGATYVGLVHRGWPLLPGDLAIPERRRYAGLWREALAGLERKYARAGAEAA